MKRQNMIRIKNVMVSGILIISLVLGNGAFSHAEKKMREESVYVNANSEGERLEVTITERLIQKDTNQVLEEKTYEGKEEDELPVEVSFSYDLDGKSVRAEEVAGKSGTVRITVSYTNRSQVKKKINGKKEQVYTPYLMATVMVLSSEHFSNVKIDHGKVMSQDDSYMVFGYGLPGLAESLKIEDKELKSQIPDSFTITAEVKNFELDRTLTYASTEIFSEFDLEDDSLLDDVESSLNTLTDFSEKLVNGSNKIAASFRSFNQQFTQYATGEKGINQGITKVTKGGSTLQKGICSYVSGVNTLADGMGNYVAATKQVTDGAQALYRGIQNLPASHTAFSGVLKNYTAVVDEMAKEETATTLKNDASAMKAGITDINTDLTELEGTFDSYATTIATLREQADLCEDADRKQILLTCAQELETLSERQKESVTALKTTTSSDGKLKLDADNLSTDITKMVDGIQALSEKSETLRNADSKIATGISSLEENGKKLSEGSIALSKKNASVTKGVKQIKKAGKTMTEGGKSLTKGMNQLSKGSNRLHKATKKVSRAVGMLQEGTADLSSGMKKFDQSGIRKLEQMYREDFLGMKERLSALIDCAKNDRTFANNKKEENGSVRFVIETEAIKAE